jgi:O-6-methylguanine DNA methyltransferase
MRDKQIILKSTIIDTPLGEMLVIADEQRLYLLEFRDVIDLQANMEAISLKQQDVIYPGNTMVIAQLQDELVSYFRGDLKSFSTKICIQGSDFQVKAWQELIKISYGNTITYQQQARLLAKPNAYRAVANANACNRLAIIIPCHRVINKNGKIGGYKAGIERKAWLLAHEVRQK